MAEQMTRVAVHELSGGPLDWAVANTPEHSGMSAWQFLVDDLYSRRRFNAQQTMELIGKHAVELVPEDPYTEGGGDWFATCMSAEGRRCRFIGESPEVAVRRAIVGAHHGVTIEVPNRVLEHYA